MPKPTSRGISTTGIRCPCRELERTQKQIETLERHEEGHQQLLRENSTALAQRDVELKEVRRELAHAWAGTAGRRRFI